VRIQQHQRSIDRANRVPLAHIDEPGGAQHRRQAPLDVVSRRLEAVDKLDGQEQHSHQPVARRAPIGDHDASTGHEHPGDFFSRGALGIATEVVKQQAREDDVAGPIGIGKIGGRPGLELQLHACGIRLAPRALDHARVGIDPDHPRGRLTLAGADRQRARAAAQVKHSFPDPNRGEVQQALLEPNLARRRAHERIVETHPKPAERRHKARSVRSPLIGRHRQTVPRARLACHTRIAQQASAEELSPDALAWADVQAPSAQDVALPLRLVASGHWR
jgi:hypothetical protein